MITAANINAASLRGPAIDRQGGAKKNGIEREGSGLAYGTILEKFWSKNKNGGLGMQVERWTWITREMVRANPDKLFLFGDNVDEKGFGGQAKEMRGELNAIGIPTKWRPNMQSHAFFSDDDFLQIKVYIDQAFQRVYRMYDFDRYTAIVIPADGIGTGLAELDVRAPKTFAYLQERLAALEGL